MSTSLFDLFSIGIGSSSSHTLGPMRSSLRFLQSLEKQGVLFSIQKIQIDLFGSLALTGEGHYTDKALVLGLLGFKAEEVDPSRIDSFVETIKKEKAILLLGQKSISFNWTEDILFHKDKKLPLHANSLKITAFLENGDSLSEVFYSLGGGFIATHEEMKQKQNTKTTAFVPFPFQTAEELLLICQEQAKTIAQIVMANEKATRSEIQVRSYLFSLWKEMKLSIERGCSNKGFLPGGLNVKRRASILYEKLVLSPFKEEEFMEWVSVFAMAVCEENASMGRVVTSPTNGASGVLPAVLAYYEKFIPSFCVEGVVDYFLTSAAIGHLFKEGASISAAEMGCQGEIGVASSMAAAGLTAALGGSVSQVENAAEIAMEHHLGLTCDPVKGLVQVPCIERNTMGAVKAILAAKLSLKGDGSHIVSLDSVIQTMKKTGEDMKDIYKETSLGGLALFSKQNIPLC